MHQRMKKEEWWCAVVGNGTRREREGDLWHHLQSATDRVSGECQCHFKTQKRLLAGQASREMSTSRQEAEGLRSAVGGDFNWHILPFLFLLQLQHKYQLSNKE